MISATAGELRRIAAEDILSACELVAEDAPIGFHEEVASRLLTFRGATVAEVESWATMVLERMHRPQARRSPEENQEAFERGWKENLETALREGVSAASLRPRYFRATPFLRYRHGLIVSENEHLEHDLFTLVRLLVFHRYLADCSAIQEYGCGSCGNLLLLGGMFPAKTFRALDWAEASVEIAEVIARHTGLDLAGSVLDMRRPPEAELLADGTAVLTVHALEQLGQDFDPLIDHFLTARPRRVVHLEPILEFYEPTNVYDHLAIEYSRRRGYLDGYLTRLRQLEAEGRLEIVKAVRPAIGGVIHEASLIVWEPR